VEDFSGKSCARCGATDSFLDEILGPNGARSFYCSDTGYCDKRRTGWTRS